MTTDTPEPVFDHLLRMTDRRGTFEHARLSEPDPEHGYCTDDMARVLVVATREPGLERTLNGVARIALQFLGGAQALTGACRNRMDSKGNWVDEPGLEDAWGRCVWGLGTAAAHSDVVWARQSAIMQFERAAQERSPWPRAMAFAALGAAEMLAFDPENRAARLLIIDYAASVAEPNGDPAWPWPEPRLTYANAVLPEAMIAAGAALEDATPAAARSGSVGLAARLRNQGRSPFAHSGRRQRARGRRTRLRSAADRGVVARRCVRTCRGRRRRCDVARRRARCGGLVPGRQRRRAS